MITPRTDLDFFHRRRKMMTEFLIKDARRRWLASRRSSDAVYWAYQVDWCLDRYIREFFVSREDATP